jgi:hypothetical protein
MDLEKETNLPRGVLSESLPRIASAISCAANITFASTGPATAKFGSPIPA